MHRSQPRAAYSVVSTILYVNHELHAHTAGTLFRFFVRITGNKAVVYLPEYRDYCALGHCCAAVCGRWGSFMFESETALQCPQCPSTPRLPNIVKTCRMLLSYTCGIIGCITWDLSIQPHRSRNRPPNKLRRSPRPEYMSGHTRHYQNTLAVGKSSSELESRLASASEQSLAV